MHFIYPRVINLISSCVMFSNVVQAKDHNNLLTVYAIYGNKWYTFTHNISQIILHPYKILKYNDKSSCINDGRLTIFEH
ncbi:hypothetical protein MXB_900 [Myxobolus squamalis]|nr:hypothetical protein MXB_900 [Myxobolus squamalis]